MPLKRYPGLLAMCARLGEQTGQTQQRLDRAARQHNGEVQRRTMALATIQTGVGTGCPFGDLVKHRAVFRSVSVFFTNDPAGQRSGARRAMDDRSEVVVAQQKSRTEDALCAAMARSVHFCALMLFRC